MDGIICAVQPDWIELFVKVPLNGWNYQLFVQFVLIGPLNCAGYTDWPALFV